MHIISITITDHKRYKHASISHLFDKVVMWKIHSRSSDTGIDCMVIPGVDRVIYLGIKEQHFRRFSICNGHPHRPLCILYFDTIIFIIMFY